jgi:hypothetical protein
MPEIAGTRDTGRAEIHDAVRGLLEVAGGGPFVGGGEILVRRERRATADGSTADAN